MRPQSTGTVLFATMLVGAASAHATPFTPGNLLVSHREDLAEYRIDGTVVQSISVPYPEGRPATETVRDVVVNASGMAHIYNGTFAPFMTTYDPQGGAFRHVGHDGWNTINNVTYGGIATLGDFVYVSDMPIFGGGASILAGIVRFDLASQTSARFEEDQPFIDLTVGLNGLLYGLQGEIVRVYDPFSMAALGAIRLDFGVRGIAVSGSGDIFGAAFDGDVLRFDGFGRARRRIASGADILTDIDISREGQIVAGSTSGEVILFDDSLDILSSFSVGTGPTFVAFTGPLAVHEPANFVLFALALLVSIRRRP